MDPANLPLVWCPPGVQRPAWAAPVGPFATIASPHGIGPGPGTCWHGPWRSGDWKPSPAGWFVLLDGHRPQHLVRARRHPRILELVPVVGADPDHLWGVPRLLRPTAEGSDLFEPAVDQVWRDGAWQMPDDLDPLVAALLALASGAPSLATTAERNAAQARLAISILALTHQVDEPMMAVAGWMTTSLHARVIRAASGLDAVHASPDHG